MVEGSISKGNGAQERGHNVVPSPHVWLIGLIGLGALVRWPSIAGGSLWFDEWVTQSLARAPALRLLPDIKGTESTPPLYYVLAWTWAHAFGADAFSLRSLSWVFGVATIPVTYAAAATLASRRSAVVAAAFVAVNPLLVWYSTEARAYALLALLSTLSLLAFARVLVRQSRRELAFWALTACLLITTHYFGGFLVAAEAIVLLARAPLPRSRIALALAFVGATAALLVPLAYLQRDHTRWIGRIPLDRRLEELGRNFLTGVSAPGSWLVVVVVGVAALLSLVLLLYADPHERGGAVIWLEVGGLAVALALVAALAGADYILTRNLIGASVPFLLAMAIGCGATRARRLGIAAAGTLVAASLAILVAVATDDRLQRVEWGQAARLLGTAQGGEVILAWGDYRLAPLSNDLGPRRRFADGDRIRVTALELLGFRRPSGRISCWSGAACNMPDIELPDRLPLPGFRLQGRRRAGLFEVARYRATQPVRIEWRRIAAILPSYGVPYAWFDSSAS